MPKGRGFTAHIGKFQNSCAKHRYSLPDCQKDKISCKQLLHRNSPALKWIELHNLFSIIKDKTRHRVSGFKKFIQHYFIIISIF